MTTQPEFKSDAFEAVHASASALQKVGAIDEATLRAFDETCLSVPGRQVSDGACLTPPAAALPSPAR